VEKLKPCPHCGSTEFTGPNESDGMWWLTCNNCEAGMEVFTSEEALVENWNRRVSENNF
jgi:Lar family restriction alleviation protein